MTLRGQFYDETLLRSAAAAGALVVRRRGPVGRSERELPAEVADRARLENARLFEHEQQVADALQRRV